MTATKSIAQGIREGLAVWKSTPTTDVIDKIAPRAARQTKTKVHPAVRVNALARIPLLGPRAESTLYVGGAAQDRDATFLNRPPVPVTRPGRSTVTSWREAMERFTALGCVIVPAPGDPPRATIATPAGRADPELVDVFAKVADWIAAGLAGHPWPCAWCKAEAATLLAGNVPACSEHWR